MLVCFIYLVSICFVFLETLYLSAVDVFETDGTGKLSYWTTGIADKHSSVEWDDFLLTN